MPIYEVIGYTRHRVTYLIDACDREDLETKLQLGLILGSLKPVLDEYECHESDMIAYPPEALEALAKESEHTYDTTQ